MREETAQQSAFYCAIYHSHDNNHDEDEEGDDADKDNDDEDIRKQSYVSG